MSLRETFHILTLPDLSTSGSCPVFLDSLVATQRTHTEVPWPDNRRSDGHHGQLNVLGLIHRLLSFHGVCYFRKGSPSPTAAQSATQGDDRRGGASNHPHPTAGRSTYLRELQLRGESQTEHGIGSAVCPLPELL